MRGPTGDGPLASAPAVARLQGGLCRGSLTAAPLSEMPSPTPLLHHAGIAASTLHHLHQTCTTCFKPAPPASNLHHLHQACITCIRPAPPASRVYQLHHACINCITRASHRGIRVMWPLRFGACLVFPNPDGHRDLQTVAKKIWARSAIWRKRAHERRLQAPQRAGGRRRRWNAIGQEAAPLRRRRRRLWQRAAQR